MIGDLPDADCAPPENVLFVCKLNPVTTDDDLEIIFSRFGKVVSCKVIRDKKTQESLQYAFVEFEDQKACESAYFKMDNVLIDDHRIEVKIIAKKSCPVPKKNLKSKIQTRLYPSLKKEKEELKEYQNYDKMRQAQEYTIHDRELPPGWHCQKTSEDEGWIYVNSEGVKVKSIRAAMRYEAIKTSEKEIRQRKMNSSFM